MTAANPNGPRARIMAEARRFKQAILDCLGEGPNTNERMCALLGCEERRLRSKLSLMALEGLVHTEIIECDHAPYQTLYHLGPSEGLSKRDMKQRIVHKWKPQKFQVDPLLAALFGAPKQQHGELTK